VLRSAVSRLARLASVALVLAACSSASSSPDAPEGTTPAPPRATSDVPGETPPGSGDDASGAGDGGTDGLPPNGTPGDILGTLSGSCAQIGALLASPSPSLLDDTLAFAPPETYDRASLSADGQRLYDTSNAGGSSSESEVMSFEVLHACEGASLLKTETEILYAAPDDSGPNTITDILVSIGGEKVGVSVTRAYKPSSQTLTDADVKALLEKKLEGVKRSSERVLPADKWVKQILHVFAATQDATDAVGRVWPTIDPATRADTIVLVTHTTGGGFIYCNPDPPLGSECP
jgi:hypothetical protein